MNRPVGNIEKAFNEEVGRRIQTRRKRCGFSQTALASEIGVHRNSLCHWEQGDAGCPLWMLLRIAYTLQVNYVLLTPGREFVWGKDLERAARERDPLIGAIFERDPQIPVLGAC